MSESAGLGLLEVLRLGAGLLTVLGLVLVVGWIARRRLPGAGVRRLGVEERLSLGRGSQLFIVRAESRRLLVGAHEKGISVVAELDPAAEPGTEDEEPALIRRENAAPASAVRNFSRLLAQGMRARGARS